MLHMLRAVAQKRLWLTGVGAAGATFLLSLSGASL
jgi:hypothetical protein